MTEMNDRQLEATITRALEQRPSVTVAADFAVRVVARLPALREGHAARSRHSVARVVALVAMTVVLVAMFVLASHVQAGAANMWFGIEILLLLELAGIGYGLMRMRDNGL